MPIVDEHSLVRRGDGAGPSEEDPVARLTDRERDVFQGLGKGMTVRQIAENLELSPKTVEAHRQKIKAKLKLRSADQVARRAVQWMRQSG